MVVAADRGPFRISRLAGVPQQFGRGPIYLSLILVMPRIKSLEVPHQQSKGLVAPDVMQHPRTSPTIA